MLNASEQISFPYESDFITRAYPFYQHKQVFKKIDYQRIVSFFQQASQESGWGMSSEYLLNYLLKRNPQSFTEINSIICEAYHRLQKTENLLWGIKSPVLIARIERIFSVYPQAKIIHVVRDGRDVYLSYKNVHKKNIVKFGPKSLITSVFYWVDCVRRVENFPTNQIYELKYEKLLKDTENELKKISNFLGIDYTDKMIKNRYLNNIKKFIPESLIYSIHTKLKNEIDKNNSEKYLKSMSQVEVFLFDFLAMPYLKKYDYKYSSIFVDSKILNSFRYFMYFLARIFNNLRYSWRDYITYLKSM